MSDPVIVYRGYEIQRLPALPGSMWINHYAVKFIGGVTVSIHPTADFAHEWIDQTQARFERLQSS